MLVYNPGIAIFYGTASSRQQNKWNCTRLFPNHDGVEKTGAVPSLHKDSNTHRLTGDGCDTQICQYVKK
jgi:hypothetical protein